MSVTIDAADTRRFALPANWRRSAAAVLVLRYLMALFFTFAAINKFDPAFLFGDKLKVMFETRLAQIDPASIGAQFLVNFGIPWYVPINWIVALGEAAVAIGLLFGLATRSAGALAVFLMVMFGIGGYYDGSLVVLIALALPLVLLPTGHWFGRDRALHARYPDSIWFR